jgi:heme/copper-type cytochrome/quinol oxidase subunit 1
LALMFTYLGFAGVIRREAEIPQQFMWAMPWLLFFALTVGIAQIIFAYNLFRTLYRKYIAGEEQFAPHQQQYHPQQQERTQNEQKIKQGSARTSAPVSQNTATDTAAT